MKFAVSTESRGFQFDVIVEADTIEEAVKIVRENHCQTRTVEITPQPTWAEPLGEREEDDYYDLTWECGSQCEDCDIQLFHRWGTEGPSESKKWPWSYASGDDNGYTAICYPCAMERKETGNYCAFYNNYYRDDYHHGCDSCPAGDCSKAAKRHNDQVGVSLNAAVKYSEKLDRQAKLDVIDLITAGELGLAYERVTAVAGEETSEQFKDHYEKSKELLTKGYW